MKRSRISLSKGTNIYLRIVGACRTGMVMAWWPPSKLESRPPAPEPKMLPKPSPATPEADADDAAAEAEAAELALAVGTVKENET